MVPNEKTSNLAKDCTVCKISQEKEKPFVGGPVIKLAGNWTVNHYGGTEGFLGWLALQPHRHVAHFAELNDCETNALGQNLKWIDTALQSYWSEHFQNDLLKRLYVLCFSEYSQDHFHFHIIPRTGRLGDLLVDKKGDIVAWDMYKIHDYPDFPKEYMVCRNHYNENVENLMAAMQRRIQKTSEKDKGRFGL